MDDSTKILIVDEDILSIVNVSATLLRRGYAVSHATDQEQALEAVRDSKPDLIICNLDCRKLNAAQFVQRVNQGSESQGIPFLFMIESQREDALAPEILGPKQYLVKPFSKDQVTTAVQEHFRRQRPKTFDQP